MDVQAFERMVSMKSVFNKYYDQKELPGETRFAFIHLFISEQNLDCLPTVCEALWGVRFPIYGSVRSGEKFQATTPIRYTFLRICHMLGVAQDDMWDITPTWQRLLGKDRHTQHFPLEGFFMHFLLLVTYTEKLDLIPCYR